MHGCGPRVFHISNIQFLKRSTPSGGKDIKIKKFECVAKTQFLSKMWGKVVDSSVLPENKGNKADRYHQEVKKVKPVPKKNNVCDQILQ